MGTLGRCSPASASKPPSAEPSGNSAKQAGLSQEQLGYTAQLHRNYVGGVERGERNPTLVNIYRFARALNVEPPDLLALAESIRRAP